MADEHVSLTLLEILGGLVATVLGSIVTVIGAAMKWFGGREESLKRRILAVETDAAAIKITVAVMQSGLARIEETVKDINRKQDKQTEIQTDILLNLRRERHGDTDR